MGLSNTGWSTRLEFTDKNQWWIVTRLRTFTQVGLLLTVLKYTFEVLYFRNFHLTRLYSLLLLLLLNSFSDFLDFAFEKFENNATLNNIFVD